MHFEDFSKANRARCESPDGFNHDIDAWSLSDWMTATMGELGEAANVAKKLNRYRDGINGNKETKAALLSKLKGEIADTFIYLDLMAQAAGFSLEEAVKVTFDTKSIEIGYPVRIGGVDGAFSIGDVVRYGDGPTALMRITDLVNGRAYGEQALGGSVGADRERLSFASPADLDEWRRCRDSGGCSMTTEATMARIRADIENANPLMRVGADGALERVPTVAFRRLPHGKGLPLPAYASEHAAGMDICAALDLEPFTEPDSADIYPGERRLIRSGFEIALPVGYEAQVRPRSGIALKHGITVLNTPGTIDADYRGELCVILVNLGDEKFTVRRGDRIAQLVVAPVAKAEPVEVTELPDTARGACGFGSTGVG